MTKKEEMDLIFKIVGRGYLKMEPHYNSRLDMAMDIEATHQDCQLDLQKLLDADDLNFYHDIAGIFKNLNRRSKKLENCFVPRFAKRSKSETKIDYKSLLNNYWHRGYSKDWLKGYIQCLYTNKLISLKEGMILTILIEQCKR